MRGPRPKGQDPKRSNSPFSRGLCSSHGGHPALKCQIGTCKRSKPHLMQSFFIRTRKFTREFPSISKPEGRILLSDGQRRQKRQCHRMRLCSSHLFIFNCLKNWPTARKSTVDRMCSFFFVLFGSRPDLMPGFSLRDYIAPGEKN